MKPLTRASLVIFWIVSGVVYLPLAIFYFMEASNREQSGLFGPAVSYGMVLILALSIIWYMTVYFRDKREGGEKEKVDWLGRKQNKEDKEFENQVNNYHSLKITKSIRGELTVFFIVVMIASLILGFFEFMGTFEDALYGLIIYIPLTLFIYKGHRWAMVSMIVVWTVEKGYQLVMLNGKFGLLTFIWWIMVVSYLYKAIKIENARRRKEKNENQAVGHEVAPAHAFSHTALFCSACGKQIALSSSFCKYCGKKIV